MGWKNIRVLAAEILRGTGVGTSDAKPQATYAEGRKCEEESCSTILSKYNKNTRCYLHTERTAPVGLDERELKRLQREHEKGKYRK